MNSEKSNQLEQIREELLKLVDSPLYTYRTENKYLPVPGEGSPDAKIMFVGEAPGLSEAKQGLPFVGASGRFLNELLESVGIPRDDVFITSILKDRPPDNRNPRKAEIVIYTPFLERQIDIIQPKVIAPLGRFALEFIVSKFVPKDVLSEPKITQLHGKVIEGQASYGPIKIVPLFHPAVALYDVQQRDTLLADFQVLKTVV